MAGKCLVEKMKGRDLDSFDLIPVLGLLKEHDWQEICRRYAPYGHGPGKITLLLSTESYYVE